MTVFTLGFHWMRVRFGTAPLRVCSVLRCPSTPEHTAVCRLRFRAQHGQAAGVTRLRDFGVINGIKCDRRPNSTHKDSLSSSQAEVKSAFLTLLDHIPALIIVQFKNVSKKIVKINYFVFLY